MCGSSTIWQINKRKQWTVPNAGSVETSMDFITQNDTLLHMTHETVPRYQNKQRFECNWWISFSCVQRTTCSLVLYLHIICKWHPNLLSYTYNLHETCPNSCNQKEQKHSAGSWATHDLYELLVNKILNPDLTWDMRDPADMLNMKLMHN